jgi:hypothetical protein
VVPKNVLIVTACTLLLVCSGLSAADEYHPDQFLGLDLSKALLSPKPLGPPSKFAPVAVEAKGDRGNEEAAPRVVRVTHVKMHVAHVRSEKRHAIARTRLVRYHGNPLDAQASDTRIRVWPCRSGGICNWRQ